MKNNRMLKALAAICAVVLLAAVGTNLTPIAHAEQYRVGDAEISADIRNLEIEWTSGKIHIAYHSGNTVIISEKTAGVISGDMRMRWRLDGDTLRIEYEKPGFHLFSLIPHEKELTVTLPENLTLESASVSATSGDIDIPVLYADSLRLRLTSGGVRAAVNARRIQGKLTSGDMVLQVLSAAEEIRLESTSGNITLESAEPVGQTVIGTTSGDIRAAVRQAGDFKASSTSGDIRAVISRANKTEIKSISGTVTVEIAGMEALDIHTTSGGVTASVPSAPGFTAHIKTTSGRFDPQLPLIKDGQVYLCGDGSGKVEIQTTSGNVTIGAKEE